MLNSFIRKFRPLTILIVCFLFINQCIGFAIDDDVLSAQKSPSPNHDAFITVDDFMMNAQDDQLITDSKRIILPQKRTNTNIFSYLDPCLIHYCSKGRECVVNSKGLPECVCQRYCANRKKPICGTDGMVYENHCELHRAACILDRPITFQKMEKCSAISKKKARKMEKHLKYKSFEFTDPPPPLPSQLKPILPEERYETIVIYKETTPISTTSTTELPIKSSFNLPQTERERMTTSAYAYNRKGYCSSQEYEIMKDNLLLYSHTRLMSQDNNHSKDFLVSIMFSHYDQNNNGHLEEEELNQVSIAEHLDELSNGCLLEDMLIFDDADNDRRLSINEFYQAFNKMYSKYPFIAKNSGYL